MILALHSFARGALNVDWQRWDVFSHLHNDGTVLVSESMTVRLNGYVTTLDRRLATSTDQEIVVKRFVRLAEPEAVEIKAGSDLEGDHYIWHGDTLIWTIKPPNGVSWEGQTVGFRLEYELRNGIAPIWDIAAGPASFTSRGQFPHLFDRFRGTLDGWKQGLSTANRRYRYDHDVLFAAFPATGPIELNYTFKYDDAWLSQFPNAPLQARATPDVDYRVTEVRDYLRPGLPTAIEWWRPAVRVGSIAVFALLALPLWLIFFVGEIRRHGFLGQRIDRQWFIREVLPQVPEVLAVNAGTTGEVSLFRLFLHRMREKGVLTLHAGEKVDEDGDPIYELRLAKDRSDLLPFERDVIQKLFPGNRREMDSEEFFRLHRKEGFNPDEDLEYLIEEHMPEAAPESRARPSWFWAMLRGLSPMLFIGGAVLIVVESFQQEGTRLLGTLTFVGIALLIISGLAVNFRKPASGLMAGLVTLIPIALAIPGVIALHLIGMLPLGPFGSIGVALFALWCVAAMLQIVRSGVTESSGDVTTANLARSHLRKELRRSNPALDDAWMPHLIALGCYEAVDEWRRKRSSGTGGIASPMLPGHLPSVENLRPFVGDLSSYPDEEWPDAFFVMSQEERDEWEEDQDEETEEERPR